IGNPALSQCAQNEQIGAAPGATAEKVADKHGVSPSTIRRNAEFAEAVDKIGDTDPAKRDEILSGKSSQTKQDVIDAAKPPVSKPSFCLRCQRVGPVKDCQECKAI